jgi:RNA polymerase sigma-70 factor (ECF subfamily)
MEFRRRRGADALEAEIPRLRRFARLLARGDGARADDLVQETLLKALGALDGFREEAGLGTWLTTIMLNVHRSEHRRQTRARAHAEREAQAGAIEPAEPARQEQRLEVEQTLAALDALPEEQRLAISLVSVGEMSYADAAQVLGVKLGTLMSRISRGRAAMRARLDGTAEQHGDSGRWKKEASRA